MKIYSFDRLNRALHALVRSSLAAPRANEAPMQNSPKQAVTTRPYPRDTVDYSQAGPVLDLVERMHSLDTVKQIPVRQPAFIPRAPHAGIAAETEGIPDQRLGINAYPANASRNSYVFGPMSAPSRLQSVPGYVIRQEQITKQSSGYPDQALKAPRPNSGGGGQCREEL